MTAACPYLAGLRGFSTVGTALRCVTALERALHIPALQGQWVPTGFAARQTAGWFRVHVLQRFLGYSAEEAAAATPPPEC